MPLKINLLANHAGKNTFIGRKSPIDLKQKSPFQIDNDGDMRLFINDK